MSNQPQTDVDLDPAKQKAIREFYERLDYLDYYQILGVARESEKKAIKAAYYKLANEYHPDRHFRKRLGDFKPMLEVIFKRMTEAHDVLTSDLRVAYDLELAMSAAQAPEQAPSERAPEQPQLILRKSAELNQQGEAPPESRRFRLPAQPGGPREKPLATPVADTVPGVNVPPVRRPTSLQPEAVLPLVEPIPPQQVLPLVGPTPGTPTQAKQVPPTNNARPAIAQPAQPAARPVSLVPEAVLPLVEPRPPQTVLPLVDGKGQQAKPAARPVTPQVPPTSAGTTGPVPNATRPAPTTGQAQPTPNRPAPAVAPTAPRNPAAPQIPPGAQSGSVTIQTNPPRAAESGSQPRIVARPTSPAPAPAATPSQSTIPRAPSISSPPIRSTPPGAGPSVLPGSVPPAGRSLPPERTATELTEEEKLARKRLLAAKLGARPVAQRTPEPPPAVDLDSPEVKLMQARQMVTEALAKNDTNGAIRALKVASLLKPDDREIVRQLEHLSQQQALNEMHMLWEQANGYVKDGNWVEAFKAFARAISVGNVNSPAPLLNAGAEAALKAGPEHLHTAGMMARSAVEKDPLSIEYRLTVADVYVHAGLALNAKRELDEIAKIDPTNARLRLLQSKLHGGRLLPFFESLM